MAREVRVVIVGDASRLERAIKQSDSSLTQLGATAKRSAAVIGTALGGIAITGLAASVKAAGDFDTAMRDVSAVSQATGKQLTTLGDIARTSGLATGVGATEAAKAMGELAKAGLSAAQLGPALKGTLALAQAGGLATADAASAAANAMQTFGLRARDTGKIADIFANAANLTTADVSDFAVAMSQGGAAAKLAGLSFSDTSLILTELARIGIKGSDAGTSLKAAFLQLANPTKKAQEAIDQYGLAFFDANGKVRDAADISDMLRDKLGGLSNQQQVATLQALAGTDGFRTLAAMMKVSGAESDALSSKLGKQGSAAETARTKQSGFKGSMDRLKASLQELGIVVGGPLIKYLASAADSITKIVRSAQGDGKLKDFGKVLKDLEPAAKDAESVFKKLKVPSILQEQLRSAKEKASNGVLGIRGAFKVASGVIQGDWGKAWDGVKDLTTGAARSVVSRIRAMTSPLRAAGRAIFGAVRGPAEDALGFLGSLPRRGYAAVRGLPGRIGSALSGLAGTLGGVARRGLTSFSATFGGLPGKAVGVVKRLPGGIKSGVSEAADALRGVGRSIVNAIVEGIKSAPGALLDAVKGLIPGPLKSVGDAALGALGLRKGGRVQRFQGGGLVGAMVSPQEALRLPNGSWGMVPGAPVAADTVPMMLPVGTEVYTGSGQEMLAAGASRSEALAQQMPHFATGGIVTAARAAKSVGLTGQRAILATAIAGPESGYRLDARLNNPPIEDSRGLWQINTLAHRKWAGRNLNNAVVNAQAMKEISSGGSNFRPWTGFTSGKYRGYLARAKAAVAGAGKISAAEGSADGLEASTRTVNERVVLGRSTTRARDAMSEAIQAGIERGQSFSRGDVGRFGNPYLQTLRSQLDEARSSFTKQVSIDIPGVKASAASRQLGSFKNRLEGTAGGGTKLRRLTAALSTMQRIGSKGLPYTYGGGHGKLGVGNPGFDCSGYVSAGLGAAGWIGSPMSTQQGSGLNTLGTSGAGQFLTWGVRGSSGRNAHTMMKIGNQYFESGSGHGPRRVSGWSGRFSYRHMPGYAKGGIVGRLGAKAPAAAKAAVARFGDAAFDPKSPAFVGWGLRRGGRVARFATGGVVGGGSPLARGGKPAKALSSVLRSASDANLKALDSVIANLATSRLAQLSGYLASRVDAGGDARTVERAKTALKQVNEQMGYRISRDAVRAASRLTSINTSVEGVQSQLSLQGVDADSIAGREATIAATSRGVQDSRALQYSLEAQRARILQQTKGASPEARKAALAPIEEQLAAAKDAAAGFGAQLDQLATDLERQRPKLEAATRGAALDLRDSLAGLTLDKGDDRQVMADRIAEQQRQFMEAQRRGDTAWLTEAAQGLKTAADALRDFDDSQKQAGFDFDAAMAALTAGEDDDRAVLQRRLDDANQRLQTSLAQGDRDRATQAATDVKSLRDALDANTTAQQEAKDSQAALTELLRQQVENQQKILAGQAGSFPALGAALAALTTGSIGSNFVRSAATPGTAGAGVRL